MVATRNNLYALMDERGLYVTAYVKRYSLLPHNRLRFSRHPADALLFAGLEDIEIWMGQRSDLTEAHIALTPKKFVMMEE